MAANGYAIQELEFGYAIEKNGVRIATFADKATAERYLATVSNAELKKVETPDDNPDAPMSGT